MQAGIVKQSYPRSIVDVSLSSLYRIENTPYFANSFWCDKKRRTVTTSTSATFTAPAAGNEGCCMDVINVGAQNITLDQNADFLSAGGADVVLGANDTVRVCSTGASGHWYQIGATGNN